MDEKTREKIVSSFETAMHSVGAQGYEDGIETTARLIRFMSDGIETIRTPDKLRETLDSLPPLSWHEKRILLFMMAHLPQLLRWGFKRMADDAARTLPAMNGGRPKSMDSNQRKEALDYLSKLHRRGLPFEVAKQRTADKYGCNLRTIERYWATREDMEGDRPTLEEISMFLSENS